MSLRLKDSDYQYWDQLSAKLDDIKNDNQIDVELVEDLFQTKCKELNKKIKDIKRLNKEKDKKEVELENVEKAIIKAKANISKAEDKCQQIQEYNNKILGKIEENKENFENVMNVWNSIGVRIEMRDQLMNIKFTKIVANHPNKEFIIRVSLKDDKIQIVDCDPKLSFDFSSIEDRFNRTIGETQKPDLRRLIALIRSHLKRNTSH